MDKTTIEEKEQLKKIIAEEKENETKKDGYTLPPDYIAKNNHLYKIIEKQKGDEIEITEVLICRQVPIITKSFTNAEYAQLYHEITWLDNGKQYSEIVTAGALATKNQLIQLAEKSLAVNDNNAKHLIKYFDTLNMYNHSKHEVLYDRIGHISGKLLHPLIENGATIRPIESGEKQLLDAFKVNGSTDKWIEDVFNLIKVHPKALIMVLASFSSPLLKDLRVDPYIVDLAGSTSKGKTTVLKVCASVWGTGHLVNEWNLTKVAVERKAEFLNSFPLILDDSRKAEKKIVNSIVYQFSSGRGKGRGSLQGSQREATWNNVMLSTGETTLTANDENKGGVAARIIELSGVPFNDIEFDFFEEVYDGIEENYGAIGLAFIQKWNEEKEIHLPKFKAFSKQLQRMAQGNEVVARIARNYASIVFTADLMNNFFNTDICLDNLIEMFAEIVEDNKAIDKPKQLMEVMLQELDADRRSIYYGKFEDGVPLKAVYRNGSLHLFPKFLKDFLGVEEKAIRGEWLNRKMVVPYENRGKKVDYHAIKVDGNKFNTVTLEKKIVRELGFDFSRNENENGFEDIDVKAKQTGFVIGQ